MTRSVDSPFDSKLTTAAAVGAVLLAVLAVWYWQQNSAPQDAGPAVRRARAWDGPVGPGLASTAPAQLAPLGAPLEAGREPALATDAGGHLVAGAALRGLFDSWLERTQGIGRGARAAQLRNWLRARLTAPVADEADRFLTQYLAYLDTEDRMLAREHFPPPAAVLTERDVEHLLAWQDQRAQRRQRMFGPVVARAWFEDDDAQCGSALREWQKQHVPLAGGEELDPVELRERRIHGAALEERRDYAAKECAIKMSQGFAAGG